MYRKNTLSGFAIISAIFLLVILSSVGAALLTIGSSSQRSSTQDLQGSRAYQAAKTGIEWGAYQSLIVAGYCNTPVTNALPTLGGTLSNFKVVVSCLKSTFTEGGLPGPTGSSYNLVSTATTGTVGNPDYVERQLQSSIAK